ncbi:MAG: hypothetical protein ACFFD4_09280 [Candidatus Odinarchaeota archaeon]
MDIDADVFVNSAVVIGLLLLGTVFVYQTRKKGRKANYLNFGLVFPVIGQSMYVLAIIYFFPDVQPIVAAKYIRDLFFGLFYYMVFLHYQALSRQRLNITLNTVFAGILAMFGTVLSIHVINPDVVFVAEVTRRTANLIGLAVFSYVSYASLLTALKLKEKEAIIESMSLSVIFFAHVIYVLGDNGLLQIFKLGTGYEMLADVLGTAGLFGFILTYLLNVNYLYRLPVPIHQIMIYSESGLPVYDRKVFTRGIENPEVESILFAGVITAISKLISESLGSLAKLRYIDASGKQIFIDSREGISLVVIADRGTKFLLNSLELLNNLIPSELKTAINATVTDMSELRPEMDRLVKKSFPYLEIRD